MRTITTLLAFLLASCGIFNLGGTNEAGEPKTAADARLLFRSLGDAALQTWGTDVLKAKMPSAMQMFDANENGVLELVELENAINVEDPGSMTALLVVAITLYRAKNEH